MFLVSREFIDYCAVWARLWCHRRVLCAIYCGKYRDAYAACKNAEHLLSLEVFTSFLDIFLLYFAMHWCDNSSRWVTQRVSLVRLNSFLVLFLSKIDWFLFMCVGKQVSVS